MRIDTAAAGCRAVSHESAALPRTCDELTPVGTSGGVWAARGPPCPRCRPRPGRRVERRRSRFCPSSSGAAHQVEYGGARGRGTAGRARKEKKLRHRPKNRRKPQPRTDRAPPHLARDISRLLMGPCSGLHLLECLLIRQEGDGHCFPTPTRRGTAGCGARSLRVEPNPGCREKCRAHGVTTKRRRHPMKTSIPSSATSLGADLDTW